MTDQQRGRRAGRHNAADARPAEADQRERDPGQLPRAGRLADEAGSDGQSTGPSEGLGIAFDPGLTDLGDDVSRGAEDGGSPAAPARGTLEGGIDAGLTDLGDDGDLPVDRDDDERG